MEKLAPDLKCKVFMMRNSRFQEDFERQDRNVDCVSEKLSGDEDMVMEQILENMNSTPIGQVLKKIAFLPEVRKDKVLDVRQQITAGKYDIGDRLDAALDKVLEELTTY